jgi:hypothetical protein
MTRGTTLVAGVAFKSTLATQQGRVVMPSCLVTGHEPDCAYWPACLDHETTNVQTMARE